MVRVLKIAMVLALAAGIVTGTACTNSDPLSLNTSEVNVTVAVSNPAVLSPSTAILQFVNVVIRPNDAASAQVLGDSEIGTIVASGGLSQELDLNATTSGFTSGTVLSAGNYTITKVSLGNINLLDFSGASLPGDPTCQNNFIYASSLDQPIIDLNTTIPLAIPEGGVTLQVDFDGAGFEAAMRSTSIFNSDPDSPNNSFCEPDPAALEAILDTFVIVSIS